MSKDSIPSATVRQRVEQLRKEIEYHRYLYHVLDRQEISDAVLDSLKHELFLLEEQYPSLVTPDSPTQRIGGVARKEFRKVPHAVPMLSFNDVFSREELEAWHQRILRAVPYCDRAGFYVELKIDGLAIALEYRKGVFRLGSTRGDGRVGEDVTQNLKTIEAIPLHLRGIDVVKKNLSETGFLKLAKRLPRTLPEHIEVRGEAFLTKKEFSQINQRQKRRGLAQYANPRNVAAGSIRQLDPNVTASRKLDSYAYDLVSDFGQETHEETHALLKALGFKTNPHNRAVNTIGDVVSFRGVWETKREELAYEIDGVVVMVNAIDAFRRLGVAGKAPRGVTAFKFALREAETRIENIEVFVGRTGVLTPVARLRPVDVGGVTIRHATLHNFGQLKKLDVRKGDTVIVGRAGDVIPKVLRVLSGLRQKGAKPFPVPHRCPSCGNVVISEGAFLRCKNRRCPALRREHLYHFSAKAALDIPGLGPETIDKLIDAGLVHDAADFFLLKTEDVAELEGFGDVSAGKLVSAIRSRKRIALSRLLVALGIPHVGEGTANVLAQRFSSLHRLSNATEAAFQGIHDIGAVSAHAIAEWFSDEKNKILLKKLHDAGVTAIAPERKKGPMALAGLHVVFTGELARMSRDEAKRLVREQGGNVSESVSRNTSFLVVGENPGSKLDNARRFGVRTIEEEAFLNLLRKFQ